MTQTRMKKLLDDIFTHDNSTYISFTTHSGSIASLLRITGHREFRLPTGAVIPVLIKAEMTHAEPSSKRLVDLKPSRRGRAAC